MSEVRTKKQKLRFFYSVNLRLLRILIKNLLTINYQEIVPSSYSALNKTLNIVTTYKIVH